MATDLKRLEPDQVYPLLDAIEQAMGGRTALRTALAAAPPSSDLDYVVGLISDPSNDCRKLSTIGAIGALTLGEFLEALKRGILAPAIVKALIHVSEKLPAVAQDVMMRALVHDLPCGVCRGATTVAGTTPDSPPVLCTACRGTGVESHDPDFERQKFVLEKMAPLIPPKAALVNIDQSDRRTLTFDVSQQAHAKLLEAADKVLYGTRRREVGMESSLESPVEATYTAAESPEVP